MQVLHQCMYHLARRIRRRGRRAPPARGARRASRSKRRRLRCAPPTGRRGERGVGAGGRYRSARSTAAPAVGQFVCSRLGGGAISATEEARIPRRSARCIQLIALPAPALECRAVPLVPLLEVLVNARGENQLAARVARWWDLGHDCVPRVRARVGDAAAGRGALPRWGDGFEGRRRWAERSGERKEGEEGGGCAPHVEVHVEWAERLVTVVDVAVMSACC
jgi:hypothetical protein